MKLFVSITMVHLNFFVCVPLSLIGHQLIGGAWVDVGVTVVLFFVIGVLGVFPANGPASLS
jgi:hypothetical protein